MGLLVRVGSARATRDVNLFGKQQSLEVADLRRLASIDLGGYFRFEHAGHGGAVGGQQDYVEGYRARADKLRRALVAEARVRNLLLPDRFVIPPTWGPRYAKDAKPVPACGNYRTVDLAAALASDFLDPVLSADVTSGKTWSRDALVWL